MKERFKERSEKDEQVVERSWNKDELSTSGTTRQSIAAPLSSASRPTFCSVFCLANHAIDLKIIF